MNIQKILLNLKPFEILIMDDKKEQKAYYDKIERVRIEIINLQNILHEGFTDHLNEMYYGVLTSNIGTVEISNAVNHNLELPADKIAKLLLDGMLYKDYQNAYNKP
ncbi:MAG: hypothetical protein H8E34_11485 [Bacteroidetes bacterium]|nr:hypothetical protein [Bacteroidota bacterium]